MKDDKPWQYERLPRPPPRSAPPQGQTHWGIMPGGSSPLSESYTCDSQYVKPDETGFHRMQFAQEGPQSPYRSRRSLRWWAPEIAWLVVGYLCFAVVITALALTNGKSPPRWPLGITLNTMVALFATLSRVAFMAPIVEGLGQLKWTWFMGSRKTRPLIDFQRLDDATRGVWGSLVILVRLKGFLACLGALITISALLTATITQQAIEYPVLRAPTDNGTATVQVAKRVSMWDGNTLRLEHGETIREKRAILDGAFMVPSEVFPHTTPICPSGDCEWPVYGSLGICSQVVNLTGTPNPFVMSALKSLTASRMRVLVNSTQSVIDELKNSFGKTVEVGLVFPLVSLSTPFPTGAFDESLRGLIHGDHFIAFSNQLVNISQPLTPDVLSTFQFLEVAFYWCAKSYETTVKGGIPSTREVSSHARLVNGSPIGLNFPWAPTYYDCYRAGNCNSTIGGWKSVVEGAPELHIKENYEIDTWTALAASALMGLAVYDSIFMDQFRGVVSSSGGGTAEAYAAGLFGEFMNTELPPPDAQFEAVKNISSNMAKSVTNYLRELIYAGEDAPTVTVGSIYTPQTFVHVRWSWVAMLAIQLFLTSLFLIAIIVETRMARLQILKGSTLATMCALDDVTRDSIGGISDLTTLNGRARTLDVKLERGSSGLGLWFSPAAASSRRAI